MCFEYDTMKLDLLVMIWFILHASRDEGDSRSYFEISSSNYFVSYVKTSVHTSIPAKLKYHYILASRTHSKEIRELFLVDSAKRGSAHEIQTENDERVLATDDQRRPRTRTAPRHDPSTISYSVYIRVSALNTGEYLNSYEVVQVRTERFASLLVSAWP